MLALAPIKTGGDWMGFCSKELNMLVAGGGALNKLAVEGGTLAAGGVDLT